jgi:hypothetical protein
MKEKKSFKMSGTLIDSLRNPSNKLTVQQTMLIGR